MADPQLLRIPQTFHTAEEVLKTALQLELPNALVLSELPNGNLVFLQTDMTVAQANWLIDRFKSLLVMPTSYEEVKLNG